MAPPKNTQYISSMTIGDLRGLIQEEMNKIIKSQIDERLTRMEDSIKVMSDYGKTLASVEAACNHTSQRLDALHDTTLPNLASHIQKVADALVFQTLDLDVHRRKWNLTLQGLPGEAGENENVTRRSCVKLAREKLGITEAKEEDFSACHRLKQRDLTLASLSALGTCETGTCGSTTPNASRTRRWRSACHPTYLPSCDSSKRSSWTSGRAFPPSRSLAAPWGIWHNGHMSNCLWLGELTGSGLPSPRKLSWSKCWTQNHSSR